MNTFSRSVAILLLISILASCIARKSDRQIRLQQPSAPRSEISYADIELRESALEKILADSIPNHLSPINACIYGDMLLELAVDYEIDKYKKRQWKRNIPEVERWRKAAFHYLVASADANFPPAQQSIGDCYTRGWFVAPSLEKAIYWYQKAANNGLETARYRLARIFGHNTTSYDVITSERNEWFISAIDNGYTDNKRQEKANLKVSEIIVHCSATSPNTNYTTHRLFLDHRYNGWSGIGYHYYITQDGMVYTTRDEASVGAHTQGQNAGTIGICYEGGINNNRKSQDTRTPAQKIALEKLIERLRTHYPNIRVKGHRNYTNKKDCPSFDAEKEYN